MKKKAITAVTVKCPFCARSQTLKNLVIGRILAVQGYYYYYKDIQCNACGSKYDLRMAFYPDTSRQRAEEREKKRAAKRKLNMK